jgi:hypothetical protein
MCIRELVILLIISSIGVLSKMQDYSLNFDDILNENLMPSALMMIEAPESVIAVRNKSTCNGDDEFVCVMREKIKDDDGGFPNALHAMRYHRKMINEFLCSNFVAEQILEDIQPNMMKRRLGLAASSAEIEFEKNNSLSSSHDVIRKRMLFDEGSFHYKNWLAK